MQEREGMLSGFLKDEYLRLQDQYENFDQRSLTIKGWFGGGAVAAVAFAFDGKGNHALLYFVPATIALVAATFWFLEAYWKLFQWALSDRIRVLEAYFRDDPDILENDPRPFQIFHSWSASMKEDRPIFEYERRTRPQWKIWRFAKIAAHPSVCFPYVVFIALSVALACALHY